MGPTNQTGNAAAQQGGSGNATTLADVSKGDVVSAGTPELTGAVAAVPAEAKAITHEFEPTNIALSASTPLAEKQRVFDKYAQEIIAIEEGAFGNLGFSPGELQRGLTRQSGYQVIMLDQHGKVMGYTNTYPDHELPNAQYVDNTAFRRDCQGKGYVKPIMDALDGLLAEGGVEHITRDSRNYEPGPDGITYAQKVIAKAKENGRFVSANEHGSPWGPQIKITMTVLHGKGSYE